jgi:hypothetical protein
MEFIILEENDFEHCLCDKYKIKSELDIWIIPNFDKYLGFDAGELQRDLELNYPVCSEGDEIQWGECQWVEGDNDALKYRGNVLKRGKMWLQKDDPQENGFTKYYYTGWQYKVLPATASVDKCKEVQPIWKKYDEWCTMNDYPESNHAIITHYIDGNHNIGRHYDKPKSMMPKSLITIVKTGECGRPFYLAMRDNPDKPIFNEVVNPGTAIIMTVEANLETVHAVPSVNKCGNSGSIVFRTITERVGWDKLCKKISK